MKILFLTDAYPNYVPDLLLHGLRKLFGPAVVDYPRKDCLYEGVLGLGVCPEDQRCPGWFAPDDPVCDRDDIWRKAAHGFYDLVLCDLRAVPLITKNLDQWPKGCVLIDGEDAPQYPAPGPYVVCRRETDGSDYSIPLPMGFPEELLTWITRYDALPKQFSIGFLGSTHDGERKRLIENLATRYPDALFQATAVPSSDNPLPSGRLGRDAYYRALQQCRVLLSLAGAGYDTFRFWENAACNAVHLCKRFPLYLPDDFVDNEEILRFSTVDELQRKVDGLIADQERMAEVIAMGRQKLVQKHLTQHRAKYFLDRIGKELRIGYRTTVNPTGYPQNDPGPVPGHPPHKADTQQGRTEALLHLGLVRGQGYGWGVCSNYLIREVSRKRPVKVLQEGDGSASNGVLPGPLFQALINVDFDSMFPDVRGRYNIGYTFFENELTPTSVENSKTHDLVLGGSTWCRDRMLEKGIKNCNVLIQGIDPDLFYPVQPNQRDDRFMIFSGGKFELRKGQDLVLRAVKVMQDRYPDVWLMTSWFNLWPASTRLMTYSRHIRFQFIEGETWQKTMSRTYVENGLDPSRIITHDLIPQERQREVYAQTDIGVFPNRCEGGTNLVLMEYMACGKPVIASNTSGHKDILSSRNALLLNALSNLEVTDAQGKLTARWKDPSLDELVAQLDYAYHHRDALHVLGKNAGQDLKRFSWAKSADRLIEFVDNVKRAV